MTPGEVTAPLKIPNAIALFQLRALREGSTDPGNAVLDYAAYYIAGGRSSEALQRAANIRARVDRCDDLYGIAKGQPESVLERVSLPQSQVPQDVAIELAKLDANEVSLNLTRANGQTLVFLMLCSRTPKPMPSWRTTLYGRPCSTGDWPLMRTITSPSCAPTRSSAIHEPRAGRPDLR